MPLDFSPDQATVILRERDEGLSAASPDDTYEAMLQPLEERITAWL